MTPSEPGAVDSVPARQRRVHGTVAVYQPESADCGQANAAVLGPGYQLLDVAPAAGEDGARDRRLLRALWAPGAPDVRVVVRR